MLKKMNDLFDKLGVVAAAYLPSGFKGLLIDMAKELDRLRAEVDELRLKIEKE